MMGAGYGLGPALGRVMVRFVAAKKGAWCMRIAGAMNSSLG